MQKPKLYQYQACPFCWKVRVLLEYKNVDYEIVEVHPMNKREIAFSKDYRKVPIFLTESGKQINDSTQIMRYIDAKYGDGRVFDGSSDEENMLAWADGSLVRALPPLIYKDFKTALQSFDYISQVSKFSWIQKKLVKLLGAAIMYRVAKKSKAAQGITDPEEHFKELLVELGGQPPKELPNAGDIAAYGILKSIETLPAFKLVESNIEAHKWFNWVRDCVDNPKEMALVH